MLFDLFRNYLNALVGRNQEFEKLLAAKDISAVKERMGNRMDMAIAALKEYEVTSHEIMKREDKIITDKKGNFIRFEPVWKLPIPYQVYINEIALVFLYGRPVKWTQQSTGTDRAFQKFQDVIEHTHFNSKLRQCKRIAGSETESAMLFRVFRDANDAPDVQIRVLAKSKGDEIYTRWDQYENLISVAWGLLCTGTGKQPRLSLRHLHPEHHLPLHAEEHRMGGRRGDEFHRQDSDHPLPAGQRVERRRAAYPS